MKLRVFTTGGTIDKLYFDARSEYQVGEPQISGILRGLEVAFDYEVTSLMRKDSLELNEADRETIREAVSGAAEERILITHGTDTMLDTARGLQGIPGKVVVLTGALNPARFQDSDAMFNIGCAVAAAQACGPGVYIAMNGRVWRPAEVRKNLEANRFEAVRQGTEPHAETRRRRGRNA